MKKIMFLLLALYGLNSYAQQTTTVTTTTTTTETTPWVTDRKHEVKMGAVKLLAGAIFEGTYEYVRNEDFTFGASVLYNFDQGNGYPEDFSITPFARFYFQETKEYGAKGFFVEGFGKYVHGRETWYSSFIEEDLEEEYDAGALGLSLGKKWVNRTGFVFEILLGAGRTLGGGDIAPEAFFRGDLFIGYRF